MKIAVVFDDSLDKPDGVQQCIMTLNDWLRMQGHEIHYIVGQTSRADLPNLHVAAQNVPVTFNGNRLTIPLPTRQKKLNQLLAAIQPDVLHVHVPYSPFMGAKAIKATDSSVGVVGTFHVLPYGAVARYATRALGIWLRPSLRRFHALYAGTPASAEFAAWSMRTEVDALPHAVNTDHFKAAVHTRPTGGKLKIVFLGRLVQRKGAVELMRAIAGLSEEVRAAIAVCIGGRGELQAEIKALIKTHGLENCVQLDGFVSEEDKPAYLAAADIAIFPSISGESFGISLIEPMAAGAGVVLGGNNPGYQAILGDWPETLFDPTNTEEFTKYLAKIIADQSLRDRLHGLQQQAVSQYDVNVIGQRWLEIYADAIAQAAVQSKR